MSEEQYNPVEFSIKLLNNVDDIGKVLVKLMDDQINAIQVKLGKDARVEDFLELFVTMEGTKQPVSRKEINEQVSDEVADICLENLKENRLLRETDMGVYELAHDTLAARLATRRSASTPTVITDVVEQVQKKYDDHIKAQRKRFGSDYLNVETIHRYESYQQVIERKNLLSQPIKAYIENSISYRKKIKRIRKWTFRGLVGLSLALIITLALIARQVNVIKEARKGLEKTTGELQETFKRLKGQQRRTEALSNSNVLASQGAQLSKIDRYLAFVTFKQALDSLQESGLLSENQLAQDLMNGLIAEISISPFYLDEKKGPDTLAGIAQVIAEEKLQFCLGIFHGHNNIYFWPFDRAAISQDSTFSDALKGITAPSGVIKLLANPTSAPIRRILYQQEEKRIVYGDDAGKIWTLPLSNLKDTTLIYDFGSPIKCLEKYSNGRVLIGVDSLVYSLYLDGRKYPARHEIGFDRSLKFVVPNPSHPHKFAVAKENSNEIILCKEGEVESYIYNTLREIHAEPVSCLAYAPDGKKMVAGFEGEVAMVWDTLHPTILKELRGHRSLISAITFSDDGKFILSGSLDKMAILWNEDGEIVNKLIGHQEGITSVEYTQTNFGLTASHDGSIKAWELSPMSEKHLDLSNRVQSFAVSPTESKLAVSCTGDRGFFYLWNWESGKIDTLFQPRKLKADEKGEISALAFTPNGKKIAVSSVNQLTTVIDISGEEEVEDYRSGGKVPRIYRINCLDINEDYVLVGVRIIGGKNAALLFNRKDREEVIELPHSTLVNAVKLSPDGQMVLVGCDDGNAYLWNIKDQKIVDTLKKHRTKVIAVDYSNQEANDYILTGSTDNIAYLWKRDTLSGKFQPLGKGSRSHSSDIIAVDISNDAPENKVRYLTSSTDKTVKLWEWNEETGVLIEKPSIIRHLKAATGAGFYFQEGGTSLVATGSDDQTVRIWNMGNISALIDEKRAFVTK